MNHLAHAVWEHLADPAGIRHLALDVVWTEAELLADLRAGRGGAR